MIDEIVPEAGILFDAEMISQTMVDPPPGWNDDDNEAVDEVWWKDYLDQVIKVVPQGPDSIPFFEPLKEVGPSTSIDQDFLMDEKEEDYSRLFDASPPPGQSADPVPHDDFGPSAPLNENIPSDLTIDPSVSQQ